MVEPDFTGKGIVNLMSSLIRARGGESGLPEADLLPASELAETKHLVLIIIDGLGADWLARHSPNGFLARHRLGELTSVFPSTTAAGVGSFLTGVAPAQHGISAWFTWLRELGCVMKTLPGQPRAGGLGNWGMVKDLRTLFPCPSVFERIATPATMISPREIAHSAFSLAHTGSARLRPFKDGRDFFHQIEQAVKRGSAPSTICAYWPALDHIGHTQGIGSPPAIGHLHQLESALEQLAERLRGRHALLLVTADHGQLDTSAEDTVWLADVPELSDKLCLPLCGEPRAAFCYTRGDALEEFLTQAEQQLGDRFWVVRARELLDQGFFGPGTPHPELTHRIGDVILIGRDRAVIRDRLPTEEAFVQSGVHGGLSRAEMLVPLCRIAA